MSHNWLSISLRAAVRPHLTSCCPNGRAAFPDIFFAMIFLSCPQYPRSAEITDHPLRRRAVYHRQAADVVAQELGDNIIESFVGIGDDQFFLSCLQHSKAGILWPGECAHNISTRDNPRQLTAFIHD